MTDSSTTYWTRDKHLGLYGKNFDDGMANFIIHQIRPGSLLEFGCGLGLYCDYIKRGMEIDRCFGIEPELMGGVFDIDGAPTQLAVDIFNDVHPDALLDTFDLVMSIEVAEHIPRAKHDFLFDFLFSRTSKWVIFSGARVGQGGYGHIAERPEVEWKQEFIKRGAQFCPDLTMGIRLASNMKNVNHRRNIMVFSVE